MARRNLGVELDDEMKKYALQALLKRPVDPNALVCAAGHVQGLKAAQDLHADIIKSAMATEEQE